MFHECMHAGVSESLGICDLPSFIPSVECYQSFLCLLGLVCCRVPHGFLSIVLSRLVVPSAPLLFCSFTVCILVVELFVTFLIVE